MVLRKRSFWRRLRRGVLWLAATWFAGTITCVAVLRFVPPPTTAFMVERRVGAWLHGEHDFRLRHQWVPWAQLEPWLPLAMVAAEDQRFPDHHGFDVASIRDAIDTAEDGGRLRGASTISQQTAKNLFLWSGRSFVRKGLEAYFTVLVETLWPKRRILEVYANVAELGDGIYGAAAASAAWFHVPPARLGPHEAALLAATLPNPRQLRANPPSPYVAERAAWIERQMRQLGGPAYVEDLPH